MAGPARCQEDRDRCEREGGVRGWRGGNFWVDRGTSTLRRAGPDGRLLTHAAGSDNPAALSRRRGGRHLCAAKERRGGTRVDAGDGHHGGAPMQRSSARAERTRW